MSEAGTMGVGWRFQRSALDRGPSLSDRVSEEVARLHHGTLLHRWSLRGRFAPKLLAHASDPLVGDAARGRELAAGRLSHAGATMALSHADWRAQTLEAWLDHAHGFAWLHDLVAFDRAKAARLAEPLVRSWVASFQHYDSVAWTPRRIGARTLNIALAPEAAVPQADLVLRSALLLAMVRGCRHLDRTVEHAADGLPRITAAAGAVAGGLVLPFSEARLARGELKLAAALGAFVRADGGVASRRPVDQLAIVETLVRLDAVYAARGRTLPRTIARFLETLAGALAGMRLGSGALAAFHGGAAIGAPRVDHALVLAGGGGGAVAKRPEAGFQRLAAGETVILIDAGAPPEHLTSLGAHAGTLGFEMSAGADRIIGGCGGAVGADRPAPRDLGSVLRATAAHATLVVADRNSTRLREDGRLGGGVTEVTAQRQESAAGTLVEATHDGYRRRFGLIHQRRLFLSADGRDVRGEDVLVSTRRTGSDPPFAIHFHLAPGLEAEAEDDGVLLIAPGSRWRFRARGTGLSLTIEVSFSFMPAGTTERTRQILLSGRGAGEVAWTLKRID